MIHPDPGIDLGAELVPYKPGSVEYLDYHGGSGSARDLDHDLLIAARLHRSETQCVVAAAAYEYRKDQYDDPQSL